MRVQAQRLRELLADYYAGRGAFDPIRIVLERGSYQPRFERAPVAPERMEPKPIAPGAAPRDPPHTRWRAVASLALIAAIALAGLTLLVGFGRQPARSTAGPDPDAAPPIVIVEAPKLIGSFPDDAAAPKRLLESIENGLSSIDYIVVRGHAARDALVRGVDYALFSRFVISGDGKIDVDLSLTHEPAGEVVWTGRVSHVDGADIAALSALAKSTIATVGDVSGAIFADIRTRLANSDRPLEGFRCRMAGVEYMRERIEAQRIVIRHCLEAEIAAHPDSVPALTLLSTIFVASYLDAPPEGKGLADLDAGVRLAQRALEIAPHRANTLAAWSYARFFSGHYEEGFQAARQALAISPQSSLIILRAGRIFISRGRYDEGVRLLNQLEGSNSGPQMAAIAFLALAARMRGDSRTAQAEANQIAEPFTPLGLTMRMLGCSERGDSACAEAAAQALRRDFPGYARDIPAALDRYALSDEIKLNLIRGLSAAKFDPTP